MCNQLLETSTLPYKIAMHMLCCVQAGQAVEPAALVPLQMLAPRGCAVLVGDPQQLPATVISRAAQQAGLPLSLFQRLQQVPSRSQPEGFVFLRPLESFFVRSERLQLSSTKLREENLSQGCNLRS